MRKVYNGKRKEITSEYRDEAVAQVVKHLVSQIFFQQSKHIACYCAMNHEFKSEPIIEAILQHNKKCYLPVMTNVEEKILHFVEYRKGDLLILNQHSILEPDASAKKINLEHLDLVIMPLVAFDKNGHRLGTGGGYYDRTFAFLHSKPKTKPLMIGVAFACQHAESLPHDPWDIILDGVITEEGVVMF